MAHGVQEPQRFVDLKARYIPMEYVCCDLQFGQTLVPRHLECRENLVRIFIASTRSENPTR